MLAVPDVTCGEFCSGMARFSAVMVESISAVLASLAVGLCGDVTGIDDIAGANKPLVGVSEARANVAAGRNTPIFLFRAQAF